MKNVVIKLIARGEGNMMGKKVVAAIVGLLCSFSMMSAQSAIGTVVTVTGYILNSNTLMPVDAAYSLYDSNGKKVGQSSRANVADGFLVTGLKPGSSYTIRVEDPRFFKQDYAVTVPQTSKCAEISKDIVVRPLEVGKKLSLLPIPFDFRKGDLKDGTEDELETVAKMLAMNPNVNVEIVCYADEEGSADAARTMSLTRGNTLKTFIERSGVSGGRVTVRQVGTTDPINPPPLKKGAKGKRYVGSVYLVVTKV